MNIKLLHDECRPYKKHPTDGGFDLKSRLDVVIEPYETVKVPLGVCVEIPQGYVGLLIARSSLSKTPLRVVTAVGVIDSDYRGEIQAPLYNDSPRDYHIGIGDRLVQLVLVPCMYPTLEYVSELTSTERGCGGFGSTNK